MSAKPFRRVVAFTLFVLPGVSASADTLSGRAEVIDGDTIAIAGVEPRIRLYGIDAPEGQQTCLNAAGERYLCGSRAADALASLIGRNGRVSCEEQDRDRYDRIVAVCDANGKDMNGELVAQGWALEYRDYSGGRYTDEEAEARQAARGLWAGEFDEPWAWRRGERSGTGPPIQLAQRRSCKAASSCEEAVVMWCGGYGRADGDDDGVPCENVCGSVSQVDAIRGGIGC
ncbi:MAG: thermonuclease family protein [Rhodobacteraceae bacterium]|nr:thermonuclease family protein [Paracoccaceae bacterium]